MKIKGLNVFWAVFLSVSLIVNANGEIETISDIEQRLNNMTILELVDQAKGLKSEMSSLKDEEEATQNPERLKDISTRISSISAEMDMIQKILVALGAGALLTNLTDDDDDDSSPTVTTPVDTTPPVITIVGDNPATVELGSSYTDAGATVTVITSGSVNTSTLGSYTITYTATDGSGNTSTASRTVNVVDTTAPVFTSSSTFVVDEGVTAVGTVTATDLQTVTFTIS